jgi:acyl-CoA dehydrogenase
MDEYIYPNEATYWSELEANTRPASAGATPHFLTPSRTRPRNGPVEPVPAQGHGRDRRRDGAGLTNQEYAPLAEIMGRGLGLRSVQLRRARHRQHGNLARYATKEQKERWLKPLLRGEIRSAFP